MSSRPGRTVRYRGRKLHLIRLVEEVCARKRRPVCSSDLREHLAQQEHAEIGYIQAWGQILFKAAIVRPGPTPRLFPVGIHRYKAYYAPNDDPRWESAFQSYCAADRADYLVKRQFIYCLPEGRVERTPLEAAAAASMRRIIEQTVPYLEVTLLRFRLDSWLRAHPPSRITLPKFRMLTRRQALEFLQMETARRADYILRMNYSRHLARVAPTVLRCGSPAVYCEELIRKYCVVHWPLPHESPDLEVASQLQWILAMIKVGQS